MATFFHNMSFFIQTTLYIDKTRCCKLCCAKNTPTQLLVQIKLHSKQEVDSEEPGKVWHKEWPHVNQYSKILASPPIERESGTEKLKKGRLMDRKSGDIKCLGKGELR